MKNKNDKIHDYLSRELLKIGWTKLKVQWSPKNDNERKVVHNGQ